MLESEKEEINRWLRQKWPEVFVDGLIDKIYAKSLEASKLKEDIKKVDETLASHLKEHENYAQRFWRAPGSASTQTIIHAKVLYLRVQRVEARSLGAKLKCERACSET